MRHMLGRNALPARLAPRLTSSGRRRRVGPGPLGSLAALLVLAGVPSSAVGQQGAVLQGVVTGEGTGEPLGGALVQLVEPEKRTITDYRGRFRLAEVPPGSHRLRVEALGYRSRAVEVEVEPEGTSLRLSLIRHPLAVAEVVATGTPLRGAAPSQPAQAFGADELTVRSGNSFGEMLDGEPGLAMRSFGPVAGRPVIRGLDSDRVAVLEGGQRMGDMSETAHDHAVAMEPLLAERVEVVRGPSSLLYGSSALGGVVNLLRRDIPSDWDAGLSGRAAAQGATANRLLAAAASGVYGAERWGASGRASFRDGSDFRTPGSPEGVLESTYNRLATGGVGLGWESDRVRGGMSLDLHDHVYGVPEELDDPDEQVEIRSARRRFSGELHWRRPDRLFDAVEARVAGARFFQQEVEHERLRGGGVEEEIEHEFRRLTLDASVTGVHGTAGPFSQGVLGLSVLASTLRATGAEEFHPDGRTLSVAAFAFEQLPLAPRFDLQAGIRLEHGRTDAFENRVFPGFSARRDATTVSGALGLQARPAEGFEMGAQLARAHRAPLLEELYSDGPHLGAGRFEVGNPELRNEVGHGLDLFARYTGARLRGELALFYNAIEDFVHPRPTGEIEDRSGLPVVEWSATSAGFAGGEAVVEVVPASGLRIRATADYVRGEERAGPGTPLPFIPPLRASLETRYDPGAWWIGGRSRVAARQDRVPPEQEPTAGHALVDLHAGIRLGEGGEHTLVFRVDNALDTVYRDHLSRVDERRFPMPGRDVSLVYRWRF